jgi:hypothetical protein
MSGGAVKLRRVTPDRLQAHRKHAHELREQAVNRHRHERENAHRPGNGKEGQVTRNGSPPAKGPPPWISPKGLSADRAKTKDRAPSQPRQTTPKGTTTPSTGKPPPAKGATNKGGKQMSEKTPAPSYSAKTTPGKSRDGEKAQKSVGGNRRPLSPGTDRRLTLNLRPPANGRPATSQQPRPQSTVGNSTPASRLLERVAFGTSDPLR